LPTLIVAQTIHHSKMRFIKKGLVLGNQHTP
jgi:hypothetical protein